jgi:hypothetical protein
MTYSNKRTTQIYLEHGAQALADDHYVAVAVTAPLTLRDMLGMAGTNGTNSACLKFVPSSYAAQSESENM